MKAPTRYDKRHRIGQCPACRAYIWADVQLEVTWSEPRIDQETSKATVHASVQWNSLTIRHACIRDEDGGYLDRETA